jgi:PAS domain S-box-containing protein
LEKGASRAHDFQGLKKNSHLVEIVMTTRENESAKTTEEALRQSEGKYRDLIEMTGTGFLILDASGNVLDANQEYARLAGYDAPADILGRNISEWTAPHDQARNIRESEKCVARGFVRNLEIDYMDRGGQVTPIEINATVAGSGTTARILSLCRDITERKRAEAALRASEMKYRTLFNSSADAIMTLGPPTWRFSSGNPAAVRMFMAKDEAEFISKGPWEVSPEMQPDGRPSGEKAKEMIETAMRDGSHFFEWTHRRLNGEDFSVTVLLTRMKFDGNDFIQATVSDITRRKQAETALRESEERFRSIIESAPEAIFVQNQGRFVFLNPAMLKLLGATRPDELLGTAFMDRIAPEYRDVVRERIRRQRETGKSVPHMDQNYLRMDGTSVPVETTAVPIRFQGQDSFLVFIRDITERKHAEAEKAKLEGQLLQAHKMESVGRLAGGVAHDFNNLLMGIMNYIELCRGKVPADHPIRCYLDEMTTDAQRSADLTRQLLAFARKQTISPKVLDVNAAVEGMLKLLRRLIGEDIDLAWMPAVGLGPVKLDPSQLDQILANLCVNARSAISGVGKVTIETANVTIGPDYCAGHTGTVPGEYVLLVVSDNGCGMEKDVLEHIFEPFFTTKSMGKGTGLGLATVYGIVRQNNGFINVYSEPGRGSTFRIYLPRVVSDGAPAAASGAPTPGPAGHETILLVEDEKSIRVTTRIFLEEQGYFVLAAESPEKALHLIEGHTGPIHLLLTDVVMPGMNGRQLAERLHATRPDIQCLFMSGYTANVIAHHGVLEDGVFFIAKPFSKDALFAKVRDVLDGKAKRDF